MVGRRHATTIFWQNYYTLSSTLILQSKAADCDLAGGITRLIFIGVLICA